MIRLAEIIFALKDVKLNNMVLKLPNDGITATEYDGYLVAHSYFTDQEYDRYGIYSFVPLQGKSQ